MLKNQRQRCLMVELIQRSTISSLISLRLRLSKKSRMFSNQQNLNPKLNQKLKAEPAVEVQRRLVKPKMIDEDEDEEESLFGETLGEDLDNIFSGLTDGQQLDVSPETLAKVKQALPEGTQTEEPKVSQPLLAPPVTCPLSVQKRPKRSRPRQS
jgi:hypothetical protein